MKTFSKCLCCTGLISISQCYMRVVHEIALPSLDGRPAVFPHSEAGSVTAGLGVSGQDGVRVNMGVGPNQAFLQKY